MLYENFIKRVADVLVEQQDRDKATIMFARQTNGKTVSTVFMLRKKIREMSKTPDFYSRLDNIRENTAAFYSGEPPAEFRKWYLGRNKHVAIEFLDGLSAAKVGKKYGMSGTRVRQILNKLTRRAGFTPRMGGNHRMAPAKELREDKDLLIPLILGLRHE